MSAVCRKWVGLFSIAVVCCLVAAPLEGADVPADRVLVMYFHRTERCPTCQKMGNYAMEAVKQGFAGQIQAGTVAFHFVDYENPRNAALAKGYRIDSPALIVAKIRNNKVAAYGNLDKIWMNVTDKNAFVRYVQDNVAAFSR